MKAVYVSTRWVTTKTACPGKTSSRKNTRQREKTSPRQVRTSIWMRTHFRESASALEVNCICQCVQTSVCQADKCQTLARSRRDTCRRRLRVVRALRSDVYGHARFTKQSCAAWSRRGASEVHSSNHERSQFCGGCARSVCRRDTERTRQGVENGAARLSLGL